MSCAERGDGCEQENWQWLKHLFKWMDTFGSYFCTRGKPVRITHNGRIQHMFKCLQYEKYNDASLDCYGSNGSWVSLNRMTLARSFSSAGCVFVREEVNFHHGFLCCMFPFGGHSWQLSSNPGFSFHPALVFQRVSSRQRTSGSCYPGEYSGHVHLHEILQRSEGLWIGGVIIWEIQASK